MTLGENQFESSLFLKNAFYSEKYSAKKISKQILQLILFSMPQSQLEKLATAKQNSNKCCTAS